MSKRTYHKIELAKSSRQEIQEYLIANAGKMPACVENVLNIALKGEGKFAESTAVLSLRLEMKIVPSSEKCNLGVAGSKPGRKKRTDVEMMEHHRKMANFHKRQEKAAARRQRRKEEKQKADEEKRRGKASPSSEETPGTKPSPVDSDEEESELSDDDLEVESEEFIQAQTQAGAETDQDEFAPSNFSIYASESENLDDCDNVLVPLSDQERINLGNDPISSSYDVLERIDLVIDCRWKRLLVETATNCITGNRVTASTAELGPEGTQLTWQAVVNIIISIFGYAIPMRRLEKMLGEKLSTVTMVNISDNFARRFVPIYLYLSQIVADADILSTDDTSTRVNEVTEWKKKVTEYEERIKGMKKEAKKPEPPVKPWEERDRRRRERCKEKNEIRAKQGKVLFEEPLPSLFKILQEYFGFEFDRKKPGKGTKIALHTTVVHGTIDSKDPKSRVVLYRTHFGCAGNFLDKILLSRPLAKKKLFIHGDMSAENNPSDSRITGRFKIKYAGCLSHARRPFFRYRAQDSDLAGIMLSGFAIISNVEKMIDSKIGRNSINTILSRQNLAKPYWESIRRTAEANLNVWSNLTPLGKGIRYIINNYENLTLYLSNPKLCPTNNDSENLLRWEALADASSFGCDSIEGRMRCDIIRSALATCAFGRVDARKYLLFILLAPPELIDEHPDLFTPQAFSRWTSPQANLLPSDHSQQDAHAFAQKALHIYSLQFS